MGTYTGPNIVKEGLIYLVDAGSERSYSGSGTSVSSLVGSASSTMHNSVGFQSGVAYGAWRFDGTDDYIKTTSVLVSSPTQLTIGGWFKRNGSNTGYATMLQHGLDSSIGASSFHIGMETSNNQILGAIGSNTGISGGWQNGRTGVYAAQDVWYYVVSSWDGGQVKIYVDGVLKKTYTLTTYTNNTTPTRLGTSGEATGSYWFNGDIANVFIAPNVSFSADEVLKNYNSQKNRYL